MNQDTRKTLRLGPAAIVLGLAFFAGLANASEATRGSGIKTSDASAHSHESGQGSPKAKHSIHRQHRADGAKQAKHLPRATFLKDVSPLMKKYGLLMTVDVGFYDQQANKVIEDGDKNLGTFSWRLYTDWRFLKLDKAGSLFFNFTLLGSSGFNYAADSGTWTRNIGSVSELNGNIYPDAAAIDEMFIKFVSPSSRYVLGIGKLDLSNRFDTNRVANSAFRQFFAFALENNLSIPWPDYGGIGAFFRVNFENGNYIMVAGAPSIVNHPFEFGNEITDGDWYQMVEVGITVDIPLLGTGHYKLTPWHNHVNGSGGFGVGINFDQAIYFEDLVSFFRFGYGEPNATPIELFASFGLTWLKPFGREHDMFGVGIGWSHPSPTRWGPTAPRDPQSETLIEIFYRVSIFSWMSLTPDFQVVHHPANDRQRDVVFIPGIRLHLSF